MNRYKVGGLSEERWWKRRRRVGLIEPRAETRDTALSAAARIRNKTVPVRHAWQVRRHTSMRTCVSVSHEACVSQDDASVRHMTMTRVAQQDDAHVAHERVPHDR